MKRFIKHYALEIYTVLALIFIVSTAMMDHLSYVQKLVVIDSLLFILHEWEEGHYPGGFVKLVAGLIDVRVDDQTARASRIPAGIFLLLLSVVPFVCHDVPLITVSLATFGIIEGVVHTLGIRLFRMEHFYTPGMVTAWLELVVSVLLLVHLASNHLATWHDYVFGAILMFFCFGCLQKTMTLLVGVNYSDMPGMIRKKWMESPSRTSHLAE